MRASAWTDAVNSVPITGAAGPAVLAGLLPTPLLDPSQVGEPASDCTPLTETNGTRMCASIPQTVTHCDDRSSAPSSQ